MKKVHFNNNNSNLQIQHKKILNGFNRPTISSGELQSKQNLHQTRLFIPVFQETR